MGNWVTVNGPSSTVYCPPSIVPRRPPSTVYRLPSTMHLCLIPLKTIPRRPRRNWRRFQSVMESVGTRKPDLVCLPECAFTGYLYEEDDLRRFAEPVPGPTTEAMGAIARRYGTFVCFGLLEQSAEGVYDTAVLLDREGEIRLVQRKISERSPFARGERIHSVATELGQLAILTCGDLFAPQAVAQLPPELNLLLVPMARAFAGRSPHPERWETEERAAYLQAVRETNSLAALVNALEIGVAEPSFGGALFVSPRGELLAESPHGTDEVLFYDGR